MKKMSRSVKLHDDRTPELNQQMFLIKAMEFYQWYKRDAETQSKKTGKDAVWCNLVEKQMWRDVIKLAHEQGLIEAYNLGTGKMLLPNGKILSCNQKTKKE